MSATILPFPIRGTAIARRDERIVAGLREIELRFDQVLAYIREGDIRSAETLAMVGSMEASELEGVILGVDR